MTIRPLRFALVFLLALGLSSSPARAQNEGQEIARIVGCSREMVGRVLKELEERGLITARGKTMVIFGTR